MVLESFQSSRSVIEYGVVKCYSFRYGFGGTKEEWESICAVIRKITYFNDGRIFYESIYDETLEEIYR